MTPHLLRLRSGLRSCLAPAAALLMAAAATTTTPAHGQSPADAPVKIVGGGLTYLRYAAHPSQVTAGNSGGYVHYSQFGKPLKAPRTVNSIAKWSKPVDENAIVTGYIKIETAGQYAFRTDSDYDRNELLIDGKIVCAFGDGPNKGQTVQLRAGLLPIVSVGYAITTTEVRVQWMPPGATQWADIPNKLLGHTKAE